MNLLLTHKNLGFMNGKKILFVSSELVPYLPENQVSLMSYESPRVVNSNGGQIRIFMPRYGVINERRHQLHEVIRLSGMNLVVNDMDMPLIIKVASIPKERIQVYFIDNDEYFKRKSTFTDTKGKMHEDNDERSIFFAKGVIETVKKLNWAPDIIHVHGWMASLLPLYLKNFYKDEAMFNDTKIITSIYEEEFEGVVPGKICEKIAFDNIDLSTFECLQNPNHTNLLKVAADHSDGLIFAGEKISDDLQKYCKSSGKPILEYVPVQETEEAYINFYNSYF